MVVWPGLPDYSDQMDRLTSIPQHIWDTITDEARVAIVEGLEKQIADLEERLNSNSTNSSEAPSTIPLVVTPAAHEAA